jgi:ABC-type Zn uptake system ZnuABC Zn-binding protein ZnuA
MNFKIRIIVEALAALAFVSSPATSHAEATKLSVVGTQSTFASIAQFVGGDRVTVDYIVRGDQDPHFVRPRPSLAQKLAGADLFISTGLDLELWAPALVDMSRNKEIRSGQRRYVSAAQGIRMLEIPQSKSRGEGGVHIYGNPHLQTSPINARVIAKNIATGLSNIDPEGRAIYAANYERFCAEIDRRLYGQELLSLVGAETLNRMAERPDRLWTFLEGQQYQGRPLSDRVGGWLQKGRPFRGQKAVAYHKNWAYFSELFGLKIRNYVEPRPSIPPSPRHVEEVITQMRDEHIGVIIAANYYDETQINTIAQRVGAKAVIIPMGVHGTPEARDYFSLIDVIVTRIAAAYE